MVKVEFGELAKELGLSKKTIRRLVYMPHSALRYTEKREGDKRTQYFDKNVVIEMLKKGGE